MGDIWSSWEIHVCFLGLRIQQIAHGWKLRGHETPVDGPSPMEDMPFLLGMCQLFDGLINLVGLADNQNTRNGSLIGGTLAVGMVHLRSRFWRVVLYGIVLVAFFSMAGWVEVVHGSEGKLPRGKAKFDRFIFSDYPKVEKTVNKNQEFRCREWVASYLPSAVHPSDEAGNVLLLVKATTKKAIGKFQLLKLDTEKGTYEVLMVFKKNLRSHMITHGKPLQGITALSFVDQKQPDCQFGEAQGVGIRLSIPRTANISFRRSFYKVMQSDTGPVVADMRSKRLVEFDIEAMQYSARKPLPNNFIPLYLSKDRGELTGLVTEKSAGLLETRSLNTLRVKAKLRVKRTERLLQFYTNFGLLSEPKRGLFRIKLVVPWSGRQEKTFDLKNLPPFLTLDKTAAAMDFENLQTVFLGNSPIMRKRWRRAYLYDLQQDQVEMVVKPPAGLFVSDVILLNREDKIVFLLSRVYDDILHSVRIYYRNLKKWRVVAI